MININELRRLAQAALIGPDGFSMRWLKLLRDFQEEANPSVICELLDRLEAAEKAVTEAYQRGYATGQEEIEKERDALRAKVAEMEQQEPVGVLHVGSYYGEELQDWEFEANQCACDKLNEVYVSNPTSLPLYALPGAQAQPAPSVPEGWIKDLVCIQHAMAMNNWNWESDASNDTKRAAYAAVARLLATAPEAKP